MWWIKLILCVLTLMWVIPHIHNALQAILFGAIAFSAYIKGSKSEEEQAREANELLRKRIDSNAPNRDIVVTYELPDGTASHSIQNARGRIKRIID